jgi:TATA-box binding protein (TBP) (component of TFIID and TFIIIB)
MTVTGHLGAIPDLQQLYDNCAFVPYWWIGEGVLKIEFGDQRKGFCMEDILHTSTKTKKRFFNQSSLVFRLRLDDSNTRFKETNIKIFKNGGFQMTGVSSEAMARAALTQFIALHKSRGVWPGEEAAKARIAKFDICMMNSDYNVGKAIRRDRLYKILVEDYGLWSTYEPTIYQGVNTKFFWNKARPATAPPGICVCPSPCEGDGSGYAVGSCKKITISPFRTGSIIITGAKHMEQLQDAHRFINGVLEKHPDVLRDEDPTPEPKKKMPATPTTTEGVLRLKMRSSPRNVVRLT